MLSAITFAIGLLLFALFFYSYLISVYVLGLQYILVSLFSVYLSNYFFLSLLNLNFWLIDYMDLWSSCEHQQNRFLKLVMVLAINCAYPEELGEKFRPVQPYTSPRSSIRSGHSSQYVILILILSQSLLIQCRSVQGREGNTNLAVLQGLQW